MLWGPHGSVAQWNSPLPLLIPCLLRPWHQVVTHTPTDSIVAACEVAAVVFKTLQRRVSLGFFTEA